MAIVQQEEITPYLLNTLRKAKSNLGNDCAEWLGVFAVYLLGQFEEQEAYPYLLDVLTWEESEIKELLGVILNEDYSSILYATFNGDINSLIDVILNKELDPFARVTALTTYLYF